MENKSFLFIYLYRFKTGFSFFKVSFGAPKNPCSDTVPQKRLNQARLNVTWKANTTEAIRLYVLQRSVVTLFSDSQVC